MAERPKYLEQALIGGVIAGGIIGGVINGSVESAISIGVEWFIGHRLFLETAEDLHKFSLALIGGRKMESIYRSAWAIAESTIGGGLCGHVLGGASGSPEMQNIATGLGAAIGFARAGLGIMREQSHVEELLREPPLRY